MKSCLLALLCGGLVPVGLAAPAAAADPPGTYGTVKIDDVVFDDAPDNQPHDGGRGGRLCPAASTSRAT